MDSTRAAGGGTPDLPTPSLIDRNQIPPKTIKPLIRGKRHGISDALLLEGLEKVDSIRGTVFAKAKFNRGESSIRWLSDRCVIIEPRRNQGKLGDGAHKVAKLCYVLTQEGDQWRVTPTALIKERRIPSYKRAPLINPLLESLDHPNLLIIRTTDKLPDSKGVERQAYLAPLAKGDLNNPELIKELTPKQKLKACLELTRGLIYLHSNNLIHGDLHPGNCMIFEEDGTYIARIADFDTVKAPEEERLFYYDALNLLYDIKSLLDPIQSTLPYANQEVLEELYKCRTNPELPLTAPQILSVLESIEIA